MNLRRAYWLFFHPAAARNAWERIDANMTIAISNVVIAAILFIGVFALRVWRLLR